MTPAETQRPPAFEQRATVHQLRVFKAVADANGFSRAAAQLHISQPAVSHQVKALSLTVGAPLFEEVGRKVQLTEIGHLLYEHASRILLEFEAAGRAIAELHGLERGRLRLVGDTTVGIYVLPDLLGAFKGRYPHVEVQLHVENRDRALQRLLANEADLAVVGRLPERPSVALTVQPFLSNELIAIAAPGHRMAAAGRVTVAELAAEPFIAREVGSGTRETAQEALSRTGRQPHIVMELASNGAIKRAVARGLGIAILSRYAVALELQLGLVVELPVTGFPLRREWRLIYPKDRHFGPVGRAFLGFIETAQWRRNAGGALTTD